MGKAILTPIDNPEKVVKASNCIMSDGETSVEDAINEQIKFVTCSKNNLSFVAGTPTNVGSLSELTNGKVTAYNQVKGLSLVFAGGASTWDSGAIISLSANNVYVKPSATQSSGTIRFTVFY